MQNSTTCRKGKTRFYCFALSLLLTGAFIVFCSGAYAQGCPPNIDFESGNFSGWTCYIGSVASVNGVNVISLAPAGGPVYNRQTMYSAVPGDGTDPYGGFPINCPNGSGHSIRLGNDQGGGEAEGISYEFTIPAGRDVYNLIYHYAVVFQDPNHLESEQPRMEIQITNVTDNKTIDCSSFAWHPFGTVLPGFELSPNPGSTTPVWYKDWSAVSINLDNNAGKTIRLFFKTADCTFRRHFGYAYIDVNSECSGDFVGATYCPDDTVVHVVAPYGYQTYTWYDKNFSHVLGSQQMITIQPPPPAGTTIAVQMVPFNGYGCLDTLYAKLVDTLTITAHAGPDMLSCNYAAVQLGEPPKAGLVYHWTPSVGLNNPDVANPLSKPGVTTQYVVTTTNSGGGCRTTDTTIVKASLVDTTMRLIGDAAYCITSGDSAILEVKPAAAIQWYKDNIAQVGSNNQTDYRVRQSGGYYAQIVNSDGCSLATSVKTILIETPRPGVTYPLLYAIENMPLPLQARDFGVRAIWSPGAYLDDPDSFTPTFTGASEQQYTVAITTASGCVTVDTQLVRTVKSVQVYVPTAFTPDGNGFNDYLRPILMGVRELRYFRVFNRQGQLMYNGRTEDRGWDGTFKGQRQGAQTVVWVAEVIGVDGRMYHQKGTAVLVR